MAGKSSHFKDCWFYSPAESVLSPDQILRKRSVMLCTCCVSLATSQVHAPPNCSQNIISRGKTVPLVQLFKYLNFRLNSFLAGSRLPIVLLSVLHYNASKGFDHSKFNHTTAVNG